MPPTSTPMPNPAPHSGLAVHVRGLSKSFGGRLVLKGINIDFKPGEIFVLMGPSGSGKSVFLRHLIGLEVPDQGEIQINGQPLRDEEVRSRFRMAMVFQSGGLLNSLTVAENVGLYLAEHRIMPPDEVDRVVVKQLAAGGADPIGLGPEEFASTITREIAMWRKLAVAANLKLEP